MVFNIRFPPFVDARPGARSSAMVMSAFDPKRTSSGLSA